jgi:hypothetical protein
MGAFVIGLAIWALCQDLQHQPTGVYWYLLQFLFPVAIGIAVGYLNGERRFYPPFVYAALVAVCNFIYVRFVNGPLDAGDWAFVLAYATATLVSAVLVNQQMLIKKLKIDPLPNAQPTSRNIDIDSIIKKTTKRTELLTKLVGAVGTLVTAVAGAYGLISKFKS